jgi:hypothetical protein
VLLEGFMPPELAAGLLRAGEQIMGAAEQQIAATPDLEAGQVVADPAGAWKAHSLDQWFKAHDITLEPFVTVKLSTALGRVAQRCMNSRRLTDDEVGVRLLGDHLICKRPQGCAGSKPTPMHQDSLLMRAHGQLAYWIALVEVTPEMGSMQFLDRSHREGLLGSDALGQTVLERYPKLTELYDWSPPLHYRPGDATVHNEFLLHGAPENTTPNPRWALNIDYIPANAALAYDGPPPGQPSILPAERLEEVYPLVVG